MAWALLVVATGVGYLLPLSQPDTDAVSNLTFVLAGLLILVGLGRAIRRVRGLDRLGWLILALSLAGLLLLFALDPASSNGRPTLALVITPFLGLSLVFVVFLFGRHGLNSMDLLRLFFDGAWLTAGIVASVWHWFYAPLFRLAAESGPVVIVSVFPIIVAMSATATLLILPRVRGSARLPFAAFGLGAGVTAVAGAIHLRLAYEGTLQFGTWYDFLWMVGLPLLGLATLEPAIGANLRPTRPSARSQQMVTVAPVVGFGISYLDEEAWTDTPPLFGVVMLVLLAARVVVLIANNERLSDQLADRANRDELTGLANRRALLSLLDSLDHDTSVDRVDVALLFVDLDGFKGVNDRHGHAVGDHVLEIVADRLTGVCRRRDVVARLGGDEFVVLTTSAGAAVLADRIHHTVSQSVNWHGEILEVGCSIGVAAGFDVPPSDLLPLADAALYQSKRAGRNTITSAEPAALAESD